MVWSPDWNFSFSEETEITYSELPKGYVLVHTGNRFNNNSIHLAFPLLASSHIHLLYLQITNNINGKVYVKKKGKKYWQLLKVFSIKN